VRDPQADALSRLAAWYKDPGLKRPPDAGASVLGAFGLRSDIVVYLLNHAPELLNQSPAELSRGLTAARCPVKACQAPMSLRMVEAKGRRPSRLVWRCYKGGHLGPAPQREMAPPKMAKADLTLAHMLKLTRDGATLDFQPNELDGTPEAVVIPPRRRRRR
jgi:hypothetical protein